MTFKTGIQKTNYVKPSISDEKWNSKEKVLAWAENALKKSNITIEEKNKLSAIASRAVNGKGLWRGDISELWMAEGYTTADIFDLYI